MLHRTQPQPCDGRIPPSLLEIYVRYKIDTRAIVAWLVSHGPRKCAHPQPLSIQELFGLASIVRARAVKMPENIAFHFREAIAARKQLSKFFRKTSVNGEDTQETLNHEGHCKRRQIDSRSPTDVDTTSNPFVTLEIGCLEHDCPSDNEAQLRLFKQSTVLTENSPTTSTGDHHSLTNDALSEAFELSKDVQEMDELLSVAKDTWERLGRGQISLVVAASVTNAVLAAFETVECRLRTNFDTSNPDELAARFLAAGRYLELPTNADGEPSSETKQLLEAFKISWSLLLDLQRTGPTQNSAKSDIAGRSSSHLILTKSADSVNCDIHCLAVMLQNIAHLIMPDSLSTRCKIVRRSSPVYPEVGYLLTHNETSKNGLRCCYGLQLLLESYKTCLFVPEKVYSPSKCRLQTLRFAQEAISSTQAVLDHPTLPCRCHGTLAYHLENLETDLKAFIHSKMFDFYFQAPWTCGCHALDMLDAMSYYGLRLFNYRNYVGAVLHIYNVLRTLTSFGPIPLLDGLSDTFGDALFPGGRPCRHYKACWVRHMGGRLRFKSHTSDHRSGCYALVIPAHTAKATAGFGSQEGIKDPRFEFRKISVLHGLREGGYHIDGTFWKRINTLNSDDANQKHAYSRAEKPSAGCSHIGQDSRLSGSHHQHRLRYLQKALHKEFNGTFPIARINLFKVYLDCVSVVSRISDQWHGDQVRPGKNCLCFVDTLLLAADRCKDHEVRLHPLGCKELVHICQEAMEEALSVLEVDQYFWKNV
ncbi:MAG: hypothetical protein Q9195_007079 [Heterodermia aff. obscurata]